MLTAGLTVYNLCASDAQTNYGHVTEGDNGSASCLTNFKLYG